MRKIFNEMADFLTDGVNRLLISVWIIGGILILLSVYTINEINTVNNEFNIKIKSVEKKVDFRYFNLTRSLEEIHKVKIDTHHGKIER